MNPEEFVREITTFCFSAAYEESKIGSLILLKGVQYPTASVILHFCVSDTYPILDFRAVWSLGMEHLRNRVLDQIHSDMQIAGEPGGAVVTKKHRNFI